MGARGPSDRGVPGRRREDRRLPMASTTKVMTGLVAFEMVEEGRADLDEPVVISAEAASYAVPAYSNVGLFAGTS
ncbi:serine hydrolase [Rubrobacter marinus]|uniref:Serine hydrolase n=2 Tax=Rubrobacter marinus TaxID=2653852 RepID=A0A6G8PUV4_9ACTN|nr:serine hydrolase [Rubrobacter marinus]QIN77971.1 serine hydrolase [Rubrobacter marinus]